MACTCKNRNVYHPTEKRFSNNLNDEFIVKNLIIRGVSGVKRKREENDEDGSIVVLYPGSKEEACEFSDLSKQRRLLFSDCNAEEVQDSGTLVSNLIMKPKFKHEDSESVDSSE